MQDKDSKKRFFVVVELCSIYNSIVAFEYCDLLLKKKKNIEIICLLLYALIVRSSKLASTKKA